MTQRIVTGAILILFAILVIFFGGAPMGIASLICVCLALWEEYRALTRAGHRPVSWPTWAGLITSIPITFLLGPKSIVPQILLVCLLTLVCVLFRHEPKLDDALMSLLPMATILLPGMCLVSISVVEPKALQAELMGLLIAVPCVGDMCALFVGKAYGRHPFCPAVSPHKTVEGALGGLLGSVVAAMGVGLLALWWASAESYRILPGWGHLALIGLIGGAVSQMGDLLASLVKRYCGIKDFSNLFPGHGGMLDRLDSILFMSFVIYCYRGMFL